MRASENATKGAEGEGKHERERTYNKPGIRVVARTLQHLRQPARVPLAARVRRDGERGDVRVPGQVVRVGVGAGVVGQRRRAGVGGRGLELAEDWSCV